MKVLIFYASYGGGHISAAKSIESHINKNYKDIDTELIDCMKYVNITIEKLTTTAYKEMAKKIPWAWGKIYSDSQKGPLAHLSTRSNKILAIKLLKLLRQKQPDLIISTHPFGSQMCSYLKRKNKIQSKIATIMTDFAPHDQWLVGSNYIDYFFVANDKMKLYMEEKNISKEKIFVTGIPLSERFLQNYDNKSILNDFKLKENKFNILFFGGGEFGLGKSKTIEIFENFVKSNYDFQMIAIAGKNEKMKHIFETIVEKYNKNDSIKILPFTDKVPELMSISDLVVTKPGGLTTTESLASELPMLIINPIPGQEKENAEFLENKKIAIWIKKPNDVNPTLDYLFLNKYILKEMKENAKKLARKNSTQEICKICLL